jgi:hypothetical protein
MSQVCIGPFRIAEGEQEPENCFERDAEGWRVWVNPHGRTYYYHTKGQAENAAALLQCYRKPKGGRPWWPRRTAYLP